MIDVKGIIYRDKTLEGLNSNWRSYHQDIADYVFPRKGNMNTFSNNGDRIKYNFLYDSTAIRALKTMASGFHSNLTNPSSKWFGLQTRDLRYMEMRDVRLWMKDVEDILFSVFNSSNLDTTLQEFYMDAGGFGTGGILTLEDPKTKIRFSLPPIGKVNLEEDAQGRVNRVYVTWKLTSAQAFGKWGEKAGKCVLDTYKDKPETEFDFLHYVGPRDDRDVSMENTLNMPWMSVWINKKEELKISESGFFENPYSFGRFYKDPLETFGFAPGMDVLADIKLVNAMQKTMLRAAMKQADPPMQAPSKGYMLPLNFNPSAMNYRDPKTTADALAPINVGGGNIPITLELVQVVQKAIEKGFFVHVFRAISDIAKQMNNPEVNRIIAESMIELGPVVGRFTHEVFDPLIQRSMMILYRGLELPELPEVLRDQEIDVVYLSPLAKVQRESDMYSLESYLNLMGGIAAYKPNILDNVDEDYISNLALRIKGVDPKVNRDKKAVDDLREARAKAQAAQAQLMAGQQMAEIANTGASANKQMMDANARKG